MNELFVSWLITWKTFIERPSLVEPASQRLRPEYSSGSGTRIERRPN
jgi:hypothetical protein